MVTIPRERLRAGVEYTFNLTVWKAGRKEEVTSQTVGATAAQPWRALGPEMGAAGKAEPTQCPAPVPKWFFYVLGALEVIGLELSLLSMPFLFNKTALGLASLQKGRIGAGSLKAQP